MVGPHMARIARLGLPRLLETKGMPGVAGDAAVAVDQTAHVDVAVQGIAPVVLIGGASLRVARVAAHFHHLARHLFVVGHADVPLPVDAERAGPRPVGVSGIEDVLFVDLRVTAAADDLGHAATARHNGVVIDAVAARTGDLPNRVDHAGVLGPELAHGAGSELSHDRRLELGVTGSAAARVERSVREVREDPRWRRGHALQVATDRRGFSVGHERLGKPRHELARLAELVEERLQGQGRACEDGTYPSPPARAVAAETALSDEQLGPVGRALLGHEGRGQHDEEGGDVMRPCHRVSERVSVQRIQSATMSATRVLHVGVGIS